MPDYPEVLRLINAARQACGKDLLAAIRDGSPQEPADCPIARSLDEGTIVVDYEWAAFKSVAEAEAVRLAWGTEPWHCDDNELTGDDMLRVPYATHTTELPTALTEFIRAFDAGEVPWNVAHDPRLEDTEDDPTTYSINEEDE